MTHLSTSFMSGRQDLRTASTGPTISRFCALRLTGARADAVGLGVILRYLTKRRLGPVGGALAARPAYGLRSALPPWVR